MKLDVDVDKDITFFELGGKYRDAVEPIADEASDRGYEVRFTDEMSDTADIGIYSATADRIPVVNSNLSIVIFHGVDSGYKPNSWHNWSRFDIGLLPGKNTAKNWYSQSQNPALRPKIGTYKIGWPKSDPIFFGSWEKQVEEYRQTNNLPDGDLVLYAPGNECHEKMDSFIENTRAVADGLLIKHGPYDDGEYIQNGTLEELYNKWASNDSVYILDKKDNIFQALGVADVVVSDTLSVLLEALLTETVPVTVQGWKNKYGDKQNMDYFPDFVHRTNPNDIGYTVRNCLSQKDSILSELAERRSEHFDNLGQSSERVVDLLDGITETNELRRPPIGPKKSGLLQYIQLGSMLWLENFYWKVRFATRYKFSERSKERLEKMGVGKFIYTIDKAVGKYR